MNNFEPRQHYFTDEDRVGAQQVSRTPGDWTRKREALKARKAAMSKHNFQNPETISLNGYEVTTSTCACGSFTREYKKDGVSNTTTHEGNIDCYEGSTPYTPSKGRGTIYPGLNEYEQ